MNNFLSVSVLEQGSSKFVITSFKGLHIFVDILVLYWMNNACVNNNSSSK